MFPDRSYIAALALLLSLASAGGADAPPNILLIFTDDQSHRTVSCYPESYDWVNTPHIDALAKTGVRFSNAYVGTWCMASRLALLTGKHSYGVESMRMQGTYPGATYDPTKCRYWPSVFRKAGYQTAQIGKWHTGVDNGFGRDWDYQKVWNRPAFPDNAGNYFDDQYIQTNGTEAVLTKGYTTDNYTQWALDYIRGDKGRQGTAPWYLWLCYGAVHGPFTPAERHLNAYPNAKAAIPKDIYPPRAGKPAYVRNRNQWIEGPSGLPEMREGKFAGRTVDGRGLHGNTIHDLVRQYHQGVLAIDQAVGMLVDALKESGQYDNTLIVFAADQGLAWGQHGFQHKLAPYDATIRGPLIVSMPSRFPQNAVCELPVGGTDLVPTFFKTAGLDLPWKMHGRDLTPLLEEPRTPQDWDHPVLTVLTGATYGSDCDTIPPMEEDEIFVSDGVPWWVSLRTKRYKYIRTLIAGEIEELYDMIADPDELNNLALNPTHTTLLQEHRKALLDELRRTDCGFVDAMPPVAVPEAPRQ